ncbi:hypothetical protein EYC80_009204 [Monilinia laxa]|uniref:Phenylalanine ammonia-lyase n=1 Tax=Monilinia laxa TaxID=61186 RepID=A0A5N6JX37_MONLA|nr:hypothetical protein EYC80_009204 [Monilinia laxa]
MTPPVIFHSDIILQQWKELNDIIQNRGEILLTGSSLQLAQIIATGRYKKRNKVDSAAMEGLRKRGHTVQNRLKNGEVIYGVNTGFGGTADVRTDKPMELQAVLIRALHYGILPAGPRDHPTNPLSETIEPHQYDMGVDGNTTVSHMPECWARAAILIRINSLIKGCSAVRPVIVERMQDLLTHGIIPMIPLRGSISASGDLSPLSYIGGAIQGKASIRILSKDQPEYASQAFAKYGLEPVVLEAKEGLAIVNGTAISAASGAMVLHDTHGLALLSQILTAMSVEALKGTAESFDPFFAKVRPHPGQIESSKNILAFLEGSKLTAVNTGEEASLRQDRYSIRTASQWIGPILEDLVLAHQQLTIESNSATDNPLLGPEENFLHGGNFQAKAVSSAMEKARQGIQSIGRMLFAQCTEMINPATSHGLPPNLVSEDPSLSYIFKGIDINIAALTSELGFLSNPVNHVQTAEMGNQSLNSLALISARYTHAASDVLCHLMAAHFVAACQAFDLRALNQNFLDSYESQFRELLRDEYAVGVGLDGSAFEDLFKDLQVELQHAMDVTVSMNAADRFPSIAKLLRNFFLDHPSFDKTYQTLERLESLKNKLGSSLLETWCINRDAYIAHGDATPFLGYASRWIYEFIRNSLNVPFLSSQRLKTPKPDADGMSSGPAPTLGSYTGTVYRALKDGTLVKVAIDILRSAPGQG